MAFINKQDTNGSKPNLLKGEFGYDDYTAGGDAGRVYIGTGTTNNALAFVSEIGSGSGGSNEVTLYTKDFKFDDTDIGTDAGKFANIISSIDFDPDTKGTIWGNFRIPAGFADDDVKVEINYSLNGSDNGNIIKLDTSYWSISEGETPVLSSPNQINSDNITADATNTGKYFSVDANVISNATISTTDETIAFKLTRDAANTVDTYLGIFQLISIKFYQ